VAFLRKYSDLGFTQLYLHYAGPDQKGLLEWYGREVLPRLRDAGDTSGQASDGRREPALR
jgi:hypothetical protein